MAISTMCVLRNGTEELDKSDAVDLELSAVASVPQDILKVRSGIPPCIRTSKILRNIKLLV
jgi:hypothetical protein